MKRVGFLLAALVAGCVNADDKTCTTDNPDYPDCLPDDDGGKADSANAGLAQMNDLTVVYPLAKSASEFSAMVPATNLLPKAIYTARFPDPAPGPTPIGSDTRMTYDSLRLVALRVDPCFAQIGPITPTTQCDNQIRLIFQSLPSDGSAAIDGAVHVFYRVTRAELVSAIKEMIALRKANGQTTAMGALKPHPLLVKQGLDGEFGKGLRAIVEKYATPAKLIRFTHFQSSNLQTVWNFSGFDVTGTTTKAMVIPTLPDSATGVGFFQGFASPMKGGFTPESTHADSVAILANVDKARAATATARQKAYDGALRIENPAFHSPNTIDCASCHVGQAARLLIGDDVLGLSATGNPNLFQRDPKFVSATSMKQTTSVRNQPLNVHMLSYRNDKLMIGQRVINETASVVAYVNGVLLH